MDSTTRQLFPIGLPGYQLKQVKGSSKVLKVLDFNTCLRYYYALHVSIYIRTYIHLYA